MKYRGIIILLCKKEVKINIVNLNFENFTKDFKNYIKSTDNILYIISSHKGLGFLIKIENPIYGKIENKQIYVDTDLISNDVDFIIIKNNEPELIKVI